MKIKEWWAQLRSKPVADVIKHKHRFVVMDTDTFKEKFSFQLSGINLFVTVGITVIVFIILTTVLIAFTPLREWIPGYTDNAMVEQTYVNARKIDSLETQLAEQEWLVNTIQAVLSGKEMGEDVQSIATDSTATLQQLATVYRRSVEDSLLRQEVEREDNRYQVKSASVSVPNAESSPALSHLFYPPLKGNRLNLFDAAGRHLGIDISGAVGQPVYAAYGGTVVSAQFTAESGYVISIQHPGNVITVYRNTNMPLKHQGDAVRAGEPIAYVGNSGSHEPGPHLHFEMWVNGSPVNPEEYISFN
jgi:murein DD-endopeptidase MepM/ murein hydrolase activator NlpD